jgi:hypothetical protein
MDSYGMCHVFCICYFLWPYRWPSILMALCHEQSGLSDLSKHSFHWELNAWFFWVYIPWHIWNLKSTRHSSSGIVNSENSNSILYNQTFSHVYCKCVSDPVITLHWGKMPWGCMGGGDTDPHPMAYPGIFFTGGSTNSVEDRGQIERGLGGGVVAP